MSMKSALGDILVEAAAGLEAGHREGWWRANRIGDAQRTLRGRQAFRNGLPAGRVWLYATLVDLGSLPLALQGTRVAQSRKIWSRDALQKYRQSRFLLRCDARTRSAGVKVPKVVSRRCQSNGDSVTGSALN